MTLIDFSLEGSTKAALNKAVNALSNQLSYPLLDANGSPNEGVIIVVNVPVGGSIAGIPPGFILRGPFVHKEGTYDTDGTELTPPVLNSNWVVDIRLYGVAADFDRDGDGVNEITKSMLKQWLVDTADVIGSRASQNSNYPGSITYYEKTLAGGDWVRLYPNMSFPKHVFFGSTGKES